MADDWEYCVDDCCAEMALPGSDLCAACAAAALSLADAGGNGDAASLRTSSDSSMEARQETAPPETSTPELHVPQEEEAMEKSELPTGSQTGLEPGSESSPRAALEAFGSALAAAQKAQKQEQSQPRLRTPLEWRAIVHDEVTNFP